jgi:undecaprenyl-diphosphatase
MTFWYIFTLAAVQGITEFLPISSSGHLVLLPKFIGAADQGLLMDVALHVGTLFAILAYYRRDVWRMIAAVLTWKKTADIEARNLAVYIVLATIPAVLVGLAIHILFPEGIRDVRVIAFTTIAFGALMGVADTLGKSTRTVGDMTLKSALLIGCAQAVALIPGTSRSGITMTAGRFLGFARVDAARFSFLLGMPAMAAAGMMSFLDILESNDPGLLADAGLAVLLSFFAGLAAIHFMMKWLTRFGLMPFVIYRLALGAVLVVWFI